MNGNPEELLALGHRIQAVADCLYGRAHPANSINLADLAGLIQTEEAEVATLLRRVSGKEIVDFDGQRARLVGFGKSLFEEDCIPEVVLGPHYINAKYKAAVVRIVLRNADGDPAAGSGFFIRDVPSCIVTNRHVVEHHTIVQIENHSGQRIAEGQRPVILGNNDALDLAAIECEVPINVTPIAVDWKRDAARELEQVLVLGYPVIPLHQPALFHAIGQVGGIARLLNGEESLLISEVASAGSSGSPVINTKGKVAGIVARQMEMEPAARIFVSAIPSYYLEGLLPRG